MAHSNVFGLTVILRNENILEALNMWRFIVYVSIAENIISVSPMLIVYNNNEVTVKQLVEPRREKTGLRGFRPGPTQTGLYKLRSRLEA